MNKTELITEVLNLYDVIEALKNQNEKLALNQLPNNNMAEQNISFIDKKMIELGKKEALKKSIYSWNEVSVNYDEEVDQFIVTSFDDWLEKKIIKNQIPSFMSFDEFLSYLHKDLKDLYEKEKAIAFAESKGENNDE